MTHCKKRMMVYRNDGKTLPFTVKCVVCGVWWDIGQQTFQTSDLEYSGSIKVKEKE